MIITLLALLITVAPFTLLAHADVKEKEKEEERKKRARNRIRFKAIKARWPFISLVEMYYYKKRFDPSFADKHLDGEVARELRIELVREIKRHLGK